MWQKNKKWSMKIGSASKDQAKEKELFKDLYMQAQVLNPDVLSSPEIALKVLNMLISNQSPDQIQSELVDLLGFDCIEIVGKMLESREIITKSVKALESTKPSDKGKFSSNIIIKKESEIQFEKEMRKGAKRNKNAAKSDTGILLDLGFDENFLKNEEQLKEDEEMEQFTSQLDGGSGFQNKALPSTLYEIQEKYYTEQVLPAIPKAAVSKDHLVPIEAFEEWCRPAFAGISHLNPMQTQVFEATYFTNDNVLVSAPTGAGKTNIALMAVMKVLKSAMDENGTISEPFKIIYVAPMKALAAEVTEKFSSRLKYLGIFVRELTGDMQLTRIEMARTHIIVTTPEKWDVVTRKSESIAPLVKLLILDEIHLLDDERGPVLESLVARTLRQVESSQSSIRIVGLSATLPNYYDVASFLRVPDNACFYFDGSYRPVPLEQRFISVKSVVNKQQQQNIMLEACYDKVLEQVRNDQQVMVFVHSRRDTIKTAEGLLNLAVINGEVGDFDCCYSLASKKEVEKSKNRDLRNLFEHGFGIHNAGMLRKDRNLTEKLFKDKNLKVLVCTATLAWGVNLPAHCVVIKGTEIYDTNAGDFRDIGVLDVQQIFGRAGRPDYDTSGLAIIITTTQKMPKYLEMLVYQRPIESKFLTNLKDALNAEISLGTVTSLSEAMKWLTYTYFYVRVKKSPLTYGFSLDESKNPALLQLNIEKRIIEASKSLNTFKMVRYGENNSTMSTTALGRIASNFYIKAETVDMFNDALKPVLTDDEIYRMFCECSEFKQIKQREEELIDLNILVNEVSENWIELKKEDACTTYGKVLCLMYAYLIGYPIETFSLVADMAYIVQNGVRILRGLFEICMKRYWAFMAERLLRISKMLDRRLMDWMSPLRQFSTFGNLGGYTASTSSNFFQGGYISDELVQKIESLGLTIDRIKEYELNELALLLRRDESAKSAKQFASYLPILELDPTLQPITGNIIKVHLEISPDFTWRERWHGQSQGYWIWVDDGHDILHFEYFVLHLKALLKDEKPTVTFAIPIHKQRAGDLFYIRCLSDHWYGADTTLPIEIDQSLLPSEETLHTELLDLNPLPKSALQNAVFESLYKFQFFNPIQTQTFHTLYHHDTNALVGAPTGSGKTIIAEIAMFRVFNQTPDKKIIYIAPLKALAKERLRDWNIRLVGIGKKVVELTGDYTPDINALNEADVLVTTPEKWDGISRNWQHRGYVQKVALVVIDEIHLLGQDRGPVLEVIVSRMRYMSSQINTNIRIIGLSTALANAHDLGNWLGIEKPGFFNFKPSVRPVPLQVHVDGFPEKAYCPRMATMNKPAFNAIMTYSDNKPTLIFVSSRRQTRLTAFDIIAHCSAQLGSSTGFLRIPGEEMDMIIRRIKDSNLKHSLMFGIGMHHAGLAESDRATVEELFVNERILVLVTTSTLAWGVNFPAHLVIIKGTEYYDAKEKRYVDFPITDVLQMMGRAGRPQFDANGIVCIYAQEEKRNFLKTFLYQPFPVESSLADQLPDHINAEVAAGTLTSRAACINYLTWTYYFRRLTKNPAYYNLHDTTAEGVNEFLTGLIDSVLEKLVESKCIELEDGFIQPLSMGHIASFYYVTHKTVKILSEQLTGTAQTFEELIKIISRVPEFSEVPVRHNEENLNEELSRLVPLPVDQKSLDSPYTKTNLLLQAHFSRVPLPIIDYLTDTKLVMDQCIRILFAMVDICSQVGSLETTLKIMTLTQMVSQGQWFYNSSLLNLPGMNHNRIHSLYHSIYNIETLAQLVEMDFKEINKILDELDFNMSNNEKNQLFTALKGLPLIGLEWAIDEGVKEESLWEEDTHFEPGSIVPVKITIEKAKKNISKRPVFNKTGRMTEIGFWVMIGCKKNDQVLAIKRFQLPNKHFTSFNINIQVPNDPNMQIYLICDSYLGLDQQYALK